MFCWTKMWWLPSQLAHCLTHGRHQWVLLLNEWMNERKKNYSLVSELRDRMHQVFTSVLSLFPRYKGKRLSPSVESTIYTTSRNHVHPFVLFSGSSKSKEQRPPCTRKWWNWKVTWCVQRCGIIKLKENWKGERKMTIFYQFYLAVVKVCSFPIVVYSLQNRVPRSIQQCQVALSKTVTLCFCNIAKTNAEEISVRCFFSYAK